MADEFFEANGTKIYKKIFDDPAKYEQLKETFIPGVKAQREAFASAQAEERKAAVQEMSLVEKAKLAESEREQTQKPIPTPAVAPVAPVAQEPSAAPSTGAPTASMPQIVVQVPQATAPIPQQTVMATTTTTQETKMGKEQKAAYNAYIGAAEEVKNTSLAESAFEIEKQKQYGDATVAMAEERALNFADVQRQRMERDVKNEQQRAKMVAAEDEYKNFQYKEFFEGRSGARVLAGVSMALGAVGSSITKGPNYAMQIIESAINNDLALQKAKHEKVKGTYEASSTLYGSMLKSGLDEYQADLTSYNVLAKQSIEKIDAMKSQVTDEQGIAKLDALKAQLQQQIAAKQMEATKGLEIKTITESKPIVMPSVKDQAIAGKEIEEYAAKTPIKEAADAYAGFKEFKAAVAAGASPQAIAAFIAGPKGLGQGSYGPLFDKMLTDAGLVDRTVDGLKEYFAGGKSPTLIKSIGNFMESKSIETGVRARDYLAEFERLNERAGRPADLYTKQINPGALLRGKAEAAGLTPVRKP
jgi:hypothetical protein